MSEPFQEPLPSIKQTIVHYGLATKKSLGQHFLLDNTITEKIVRLAGSLDGVHVIEIGPGPGGLTRALLESDAAHVTALEKDVRCIEALQPLLQRYPSRLSLQEADASAVSLAQIGTAPRAIIANLPYNIGTELVIGFLHDLYNDEHAYQKIIVMLQKEVAERIAAPVNTKAYGRISVLAQWLCHCRLLMELPPSVFSPPPKVTSTVLLLTPRTAQRDIASLNAMERVTKAAFGARRKMLRQSLKSLRPDALEWCAQIGVAPTLRAEALTVAQFAAFARSLEQVAHAP